jgi:hypothetical protein
MMTYLTTGNPNQRQKTVKCFLTEESIIQDTQVIIGEVLSNNEAIAGLNCLQSMKTILSKIFRSQAGRISSNKRLVVNLLTACVMNGNDNQMSTSAMGKYASLSCNFIHKNKAKYFSNIRLIQEGDEKGFELIEQE